MKAHDRRLLDGNLRKVFLVGRDAMISDLLSENGTCYIATAGIGVRPGIGFAVAACDH